MILKAIATSLIFLSSYSYAATLQKDADLGIHKAYNIEFATNELLVAKISGAVRFDYKIFDARSGQHITDISSLNIPLSLRDGLAQPYPQFISSSLPGTRRGQTELLATATWPMKIISVWDMRTGQALWHFKFPYGKEMRMVRLSNDGKTVLACAHLGPGTNSAQRCSLLNQHGIIKDLELSPEAPTPELKLQAPLNTGFLASEPNFSIDGTRFVLVRYFEDQSRITGHEAIFFDSSTGEAVIRRKMQDTFVTFSDDLKIMASTIDHKSSKTIDVQDVESGVVLSRASKRHQSNRGFRPGSKTILFSDYSARPEKHGNKEISVHFMDAISGKILETVVNLGSTPLAYSFAEINLDVFFAHEATSNTTHIYNLFGKGEKLQEISGYTSRNSAASPDGKTVVLHNARGDSSLWSWK